MKKKAPPAAWPVVPWFCRYPTRCRKAPRVARRSSPRRSAQAPMRRSLARVRLQAAVVLDERSPPSLGLNIGRGHRGSRPASPPDPSIGSAGGPAKLTGDEDNPIFRFAQVQVGKRLILFPLTDCAFVAASQLLDEQTSMRSDALPVTRMARRTTAHRGRGIYEPARVKFPFAGEDDSIRGTLPRRHLAET